MVVRHKPSLIPSITDYDMICDICNKDDMIKQVCIEADDITGDCIDYDLVCTRCE